MVVTVRGMVGRRNKQGKEGLRAYHWNVEVDLWKMKTKRQGQYGGDGLPELQ